MFDESTACTTGGAAGHPGHAEAVGAWFDGNFKLAVNKANALGRRAVLSNSLPHPVADKGINRRSSRRRQRVNKMKGDVPISVEIRGAGIAG